jgi:hypothetical protein
MIMGDTNDKRIFDRHHQEACIICAYFNGNEYCRAKMLNYCEGGLYFESELAFKPGASIYIRIVEFSQRTSESSLHNGYRTITLAEVKRCEELSDTEFYKYGIGARYYQLY